MLTSAPAAPAFAQSKDEVKIAYPVDVPSWDPTSITFPAGQSLFKAVFDSALMIGSDYSLAPGLVSKWEWQNAERTRLALTLRDDVVFHDGSRMTTEDLKFSFLDRPRADPKLAINGMFGALKDVEIKSPTSAVMVFAKPQPTAPAYLGFITAYILPKAYLQKVGDDGFRAAPIGAGPYRIVNYERGSRVILEAFDRYWGKKPAIKRVVFEIVPEASARVAAIESGRVDIAVQVPLRETKRLDGNEKLHAKAYPYSEIFMVQIPSYVPEFQNEHLRRALHLAIDKKGLSRAFYGNAAPPISMIATPGSTGYDPAYDFPFDKTAAMDELAKAGFGPDKPAKIRFYSTNQTFPSDYEMARAIVQMWKQIGVDAQLEELTLAKYLELSHSTKLDGAMLYSWTNTTGDPEVYAGKILDPRLRFSTWKDPALTDRINALLAEGDEAKRIEGYRSFARDASEHAWTIPLLQSVATIVYKKGLKLETQQTGYVLPATYAWE